MEETIKPLHTLLTLFRHVLNQHPDLAPATERLCQEIQGKGWEASLENEVRAARYLLASPPMLAIDIGGNVGNYTAELLLLNPKLEIHIFEPSAINYEVLIQRFHANPNVRIQPFAISDFEYDTTLFSDKPGSGMGSLTKRKLDHFGISFDVTESVKAIRFDRYWRENLQGKHVDILKLDIEGHEMSALRGCGDTLRNIRVIQFEFGGTCIDTRIFFKDFWDLLSVAGFDLYRLAPAGLIRISGYSESCENYFYQNYFAVNRNFNPS
jgi:FkbM family methyltransferase